MRFSAASAVLPSLLLVLAGCSSPAADPPAPAPNTNLTPSSAAPPPDTCPAGTMPSLASGTCEPVGTTSCATGFAAAEDGWGCAAIVPAATCTGTTRASIGSPSCIPVDDCTRAFPPAGATLVTDDASLTAALGSAKGGDTIALEAGTYGAIVVPTNLHLVGRCADQVIVQGTGDRGVYVVSKTASIESMTVTGFQGGIVASAADVTASRVVVKDATLAFVAGWGAKLHVTGSVAETSVVGSGGGAMSAQSGSSIVIEDSDIRGFENDISSFEKDTSVSMKRVVDRYDGTTKSATRIMALGGSHIVVDTSVFRWRVGDLAFVARDLPMVSTLKDQVGGILEINNSDIRQSGVELDRPVAKVDDAGTLSFDNTTLEHQSPAAIMVGHAQSTLKTANTVIRSAAVTDQERVAIWALRGGTATIANTAVIGAQENALASTSAGSTMTITHSLVSHTLPGTQNAAAEMGASGVALVVADSAVASVSDSAFVGSTYLAMLAGAGAQVELVRSIVDATAASPEGLGGSAICSADAVLTVDGSLIRRSTAAAFVFMGGNAIVKNSHFAANHIGVQLAEGDLVDATTDPTTAQDGVVVMYANVFESTDSMISYDPFAPPGGF